ncbi:hypothetical protein [Moritella viscosa]|uniref:hypothetical protein n=1 Tax=Moritella viscosa TaxID=80854 RepID=UPI00094D6E73|nr:hypothetical protein [Moritella viscosa]
MRYFILLFVIVVGFNAQADTFAELAISPAPSLLAPAPASLLVTDYQDADESEQPPVSLPINAYEFALTDTSRYTSAGRLLLNNPEPDYQIEIELSIPPSPSFVIGYAVNINFYQHWLTHISRSKSRLSGWKDCNILYSHRLYPAVITFV